MVINALIGDRLEVGTWDYGGEVGGRYRAAVAKVSCLVLSGLGCGNWRWRWDGVRWIA